MPPVTRFFACRRERAAEAVLKQPGVIRRHQPEGIPGWSCLSPTQTTCHVGHCASPTLWRAPIQRLIFACRSNECTCARHRWAARISDVPEHTLTTRTKDPALGASRLTRSFVRGLAAGRSGLCSPGKKKSLSFQALQRLHHATCGVRMEQSDAAGCERIDPAFRSPDSLSGHWALFREISARDIMKGQLVFIKMFRDVLQTSATSEDVSRKLQNLQWDHHRRHYASLAT